MQYPIEHFAYVDNRLYLQTKWIIQMGNLTREHISIWLIDLLNRIGFKIMMLRGGINIPGNLLKRRKCKIHQYDNEANKFVEEFYGFDS